MAGPGGTKVDGSVSVVTQTKRYRAGFTAVSIERLSTHTSGKDKNKLREVSGAWAGDDEGSYPNKDSRAEGQENEQKDRLSVDPADDAGVEPEEELNRLDLEE